MFDLSNDDKFSIESSSEFPQSILMRNMVNNSLVAKFEGHSQAIVHLSFAKH